MSTERCEALDAALNQMGPVIIMGVTFMPAEIVRELDPIAYEQAAADYED